MITLELSEDEAGRLIQHLYTAHAYYFDGSKRAERNGHQDLLDAFNGHQAEIEVTISYILSLLEAEKTQGQLDLEAS